MGESKKVDLKDLKAILGEEKTLSPEEIAVYREKFDSQQVDLIEESGGNILESIARLGVKWEKSDN